MTSKNIFSSFFHSLPSHSIIEHILFASHRCLEYVAINYLFRLPSLGDFVIAIVVRVVVAVLKKSLAKFSQKTLVILILKFDQSSPLPIRHLPYFYGIQDE